LLASLASKKKLPGSKIEVLKIGLEYEERQLARIKALKERRDNARVENSLSALKQGYARRQKFIPILDGSGGSLRHTGRNLRRYERSLGRLQRERCSLGLSSLQQPDLSCRS
jgi:methylmalonyl-CoA mutase N-terminal domain/subunit